MAGHSKWANIKHKKGRSDAKKGKIFSRLAKEIISAVKQGGPDPDSNAKLRLVISRAKTANLPNDTIERNIQKASGQDQADYVELNYEIYGHGGVGIIANVMTDNKNRTASEMRIAFNKCGGSLAGAGAVSYQFTRRACLHFEGIDEESLLEACLDYAQDIKEGEGEMLVFTDPSDLGLLLEHLETKGLSPKESELGNFPQTKILCSPEDHSKNIKLLTWLEELDDVDAIFHNMDTDQKSS